jgi:hypothetical protein
MPFDLAESFVLAAERQLGARLPESYRKALCRANGGELEVSDEDWQLYPIADTSDRKRAARSANHILKETEACREWAHFPPEALAIAGNGSGDQLVFLRRNDVFDPAVLRWSHESGSLEKIADDYQML